MVFLITACMEFQWVFSNATYCVAWYPGLLHFFTINMPFAWLLDAGVRFLQEMIFLQSLDELRSEAHWATDDDCLLHCTD